MEESIFSINNLVKFYTKNLSYYSLIFKPTMRKRIITLFTICCLSVISELVSMFFFAFTHNNHWTIAAFTSGIICIFIFLILLFLKKSIESKFPNNRTYDQIRLMALIAYCKSQNLSRDDLEKTRDILTREEKREYKKFSFIIPGSIIILPLWNAFLTKLFSFAKDTHSATGLFLGMSTTIIYLSITSWLSYKVIFDIFINQRFFKLRSTIRAIEEILLNHYEKI
ncbi:hypothetical protein [Desulfosporosinus sp. FKA]|uniref:hypothetical protein n=1 Tax=Desulfosporosinus sp. FKA TaxID=1969834 RepID=UPI000B4A4BF0|nr:hypothetical protein [Desulfosporosinus sp. FKA]